MEHDQIETTLGQIDLFEGLEADTLDQIIADSYLVPLSQNTILFYQEDPADVFYVLLKGRIKLSQLTPEGSQVTMHYLKPGEAFGIIAVLREINFPVTAEAMEDCLCIAWKSDRIKRWITTYPQIALNAIQILLGFVLDFQDRIRELSTEKVERRIARSLLRLADHGGVKTKDGISLGLKLTRQDIADMAGTTLYTVSRTLSKWEDMDLVDCKTSTILLKKPYLLTDIAEDIVKKDS